MVALWIWLGTHLIGDGALGVRFLAPLSAAAGSLLLAQAGDDLFPSCGVGRRAAILLNATLLFGVGAVTMTPDTPLLLFWTACLWALARLHRTGNTGWWLIAGLAAGLGLDSKYTAILLPVGVGLWCLLLPGPRRWLVTPMPWLGAALAFLAFLPVILWNARHDWASFDKQGGREFVWHPLQALRYLLELLGGQAGLATPLIFILCMVGIFLCLRSVWQMRLAAPGLVAALSVPPLLLFVEHALGDRVQANWPAIIYPSAAIGAAVLGGGWQKWLTPALALGALMTGLTYIEAVFHPIPFAGRGDPTARLLGWGEFSQQINQLALSEGAGFVAADNYGTAALLARSDIVVPIIGAEPRWRLFNLPNSDHLMAERPGLLVSPANRNPSAEGWSALTPLTRLVRPGSGETYLVSRVSGEVAGRVLPRP
jgi:4-amino-4-deoxy-L-arabinose transferase-like glycosyltransferase